MWPRLMATQPLLGTGTVAYFVPGGKALLPLSVTATSARVAGRPNATVTAKDVLATVSAPVAVLTSDRTASSAEAVAVAFRGRPATRSFGTATYGVPAANKPFPLSDGALLNLTVALTVAQEADRMLAVDGPANQAKGDGDAATWLPPNKAYRCAYVARQIAVKRAYHLWVTPAEGAAMRRVLQRCPGESSPLRDDVPSP
jgi:peptidase S41-like protein